MARWLTLPFRPCSENLSTVSAVQWVVESYAALLLALLVFAWLVIGVVAVIRIVMAFPG